MSNSREELPHSTHNIGNYCSWEVMRSSDSGWAPTWSDWQAAADKVLHRKERTNIRGVLEDSSGRITKFLKVPPYSNLLPCIKNFHNPRDPISVMRLAHYFKWKTRCIIECILLSSCGYLALFPLEIIMYFLSCRKLSVWGMPLYKSGIRFLRILQGS